MWRGPRPGDSHAHHAYDSDNPDEPDRNYKPHEPDAAHDFREPDEFREPNDELCDSHDLKSCDLNDSHQPGDLGRCRLTTPKASGSQKAEFSRPANCRAAVLNAQLAVHGALVGLHGIERNIQPRTDFRPR